MPITTLDKIAALIVIDLQKGITSMPVAHPAEQIISRSAQLAQAFREHNFPVVLVNVTAPAPGRTGGGPRNFSFPNEWFELVPELNQQPTDHLVSKHSYGAFINTGLDQYLRERDVTQVFIAGIATGSGVDSTARSAFDLGYNVAMVVDAMTDRDGEVHDLYSRKIFPRFSETDTTENVLKLLDKQ